MFAIPLGDDAELGPLEPWQAPEFLAHMERGREFVGQHIGLADAVTDLESARAWLQSYADKTASDTGRLYGTRVGGRLVGGVLFRVFDAKSRTCEAGCWLEPAMAGRGLATRASRVIIHWAFHERGMERVEWQVSSKNAPSINVARRLGMTREGVLRSHSEHHGVRQDTEVWSILANEWPAAGGDGTA